MKLLGKLYLSRTGQIFIHSREDGYLYAVMPDGVWIRASFRRPIAVNPSWRLIGDSYAKD